VSLGQKTKECYCKYMGEGPPKIENIEPGRELLSNKEKVKWLDGMEEYAEQLEQEIERLKKDSENINDTNELQKAEDLISELEQEVESMKDFVETGRDPDENLYRLG